MTDKEFYCGFAVAVGTVARNGYPSTAIDAMDSNGVTLRDLINSGAEEFDLLPIRMEYKLQCRKQDGSKRKLKPPFATKPRQPRPQTRIKKASALY